MRILMLIDAMRAGGAETHVEELSRSLAELGEDVTVASSGGAIARRLAKFGVRHVQIPSVLPPKSTTALGEVASLPLRIAATRKAIASVVAFERPDVVHSHTRRMAFVAQPVCARLKIAHIVTAHAMFSMRFPRGALSCWGNGVIAVSEDIRDRLFEPYDGEFYTPRYGFCCPNGKLNGPNSGFSPFLGKLPTLLGEARPINSKKCVSQRIIYSHGCEKTSPHLEIGTPQSEGIEPHRGFLPFIGARRAPLRVRVIRNGVRISPPTTREN